MAASALPPAPLATPFQQGGSISPAWAKWLNQLQALANDAVALPFADYYSATQQTIVSGSNVVFNFDTLVTDTHNAVTTGSGWKFTCPAGEAGVYLVTCSVTLNAAAAVSGDTLLTILKNGVEYRRPFRISTDLPNEYGMPGSMLLQLAVGDYIQAAVFQNSGSSKTTEANAVANWITIAKLAGT